MTFITSFKISKSNEIVFVPLEGDVLAEELVQTSFVQGDPEPWKTWIPYAALLGAAFFAIVNAYFLTKGLQHYEAFKSK